MRCVPIFVLSAASVISMAQTAVPVVNTGHEHMLPKSFVGWQVQTTPVVATDPKTADLANAEALKEFSFTDSESATYMRDGYSLKINALRFTDGTGAYAAYDFYRDPKLPKIELCDDGTSYKTHVIFRCTNMVVQVEFERVTSMSASELRTLIKTLPRISGHLAQPPVLPLYVPELYRKNVLYCTGPVSCAHDGVVLPPQTADYSFSTEVVSSSFFTKDGEAAISIYCYPTPPIAVAQLKKIEDWGRTWQQSKPNSGIEFTAVRNAHLVTVVSGHINGALAEDIAGAVHYDAEVSWNQAEAFTRRNNAGNLLYNVIILSFLVCGVTLAAGIVFGVFRVWANKYYPGRFVNRTESIEYIRLKLDGRD